MRAEQSLLPIAAVALSVAGAFAPAVAGSPPARPPAQVLDDEDTGRRFFALPLPREADERAQNVLVHLAAGRDNLALTELQRLLEDSRGHLLPRHRRAKEAEPSITATYPGASDWARTLLLSLDSATKERYRERFEAPARAALAGALESLEPAALVDVATRWPLTQAAESAWWALGDLEAERGQLGTAAVAWRRAAELVEARGGTPPAGAADRARMVEQHTPVPPPPRGQGGTYGSSVLVDTDVPRADADRWFAPLDLEPFAQETSGFALQPLLAGDQVLVNTSLRVFAVDAYTGLPSWVAEPHPTWNVVPTRGRDEYFDKIDRERVWIGAAEAQGIVVAALQIPYTEFPDSSWQGIPIFSRIPERRLAAFDADTGERLWDHVPAMRWRGSSRGYELEPGNNEARLAMVAAPPVIAGSRVLVPLYEMQSRIEYSVACFALETGELLWRTEVISGQRERNMFGRAASEFTAAPLVVAGDRVVAQSELGAIAALDLLSGELEWSSEYEQIPIRRNSSYSAPTRMTVWRTAPPVVVDGLVVAAPSDSTSLVCVELDDGAVRWSLGAYDLQRLGRDEAQRYSFDVLLGADQDTVYLGGEKLAALEKQGGLRSRLSFRPRWEHVLGRGTAGTDAPLPLLTPDVLVVPTRDERLTLDRRTGERVALLSGQWQSQDRGALVLGDGVLYSLGRYGLTGLFDWETLVRRQRDRLAASPDDLDVRFDTAALYLRRARALREREGETNAARRFLQDARDLLEPRVGAAPEASALLAHDPEGARLLHALLREEARVLADLARTDEAQALLATALELAPDLGAVRDTLLQEERMVRRLDGPRRLELLDLLAERVGDLPLAADQLAETPTWLIGEALLTELDVLGWEEAEPTVGLWSLLARADELARHRRGEEALVALHEASAAYGDLRLNDEWTVGEVVHARVARRIEIDGPEVYRPFEEEAERQLGRALEAGDEAALERLVERFPFARAARRAEESLLERGFLARDAERVAELTHVLAQRDGVDPAVTREALLRLGLLLQARGNEGFLASFVAREARRAPDAVVEVAGARGQSLRELAAEFPPRTLTTPRPELSTEAVFLEHRPGAHELVGELVDRDRGDAPVRQAVFLVEARRVAAYDVASPEEPAWVFNIPYAMNPSVALAEGRVLVGARDQVRALAPSGRQVWEQRLGDEFVRELAAGDGVVLALTGPNRSEHVVRAWDARDGVPLWEVDLTEHLEGAVQGWLRPLVDAGRAVVFRRRFTENSTAIVIDLHRGRVDAVVDLGPYGSKDVLSECAWIEDGRLCVPRFESRGEMGSTLGVYDLETGDELWRMNFRDDEHFYAVARHDGRSYLVIQPSALRRGQSRGAVYALDLDLKRIRAVESLRAGELPAGLEEGRTQTLDAPLLFFVPGESGSGDLPLRVLDLESGSSSTVRLSVRQDEFYPEALPRPAVGDDALAVAFRVQDPATQLVAETRLEFVPLDEAGRPAAATVGGQAIAPAGGSLHPVRLYGFGEVLYVLHRDGDGSARLEVYGRR